MSPEEMRKKKVTLLVSTYNRPDALSVCLDSVRYQTILPDEVVIVDDGSTDETRETIDTFRKKLPVPIIHVWQEDDGFKKAIILNKGISRATGNYIVQTDGDIMLSPHFIEDHLRLAEKGFYIKGGRVNLGPKLTQEICSSRVFRKISFWTKGIARKRENAIRILPLSLFLAPRYRQNSTLAIGCNISYWKDDCIAINGYDEAFIGWGGEDGNFGKRLFQYGVQKKYLKFAGTAFHLWHKTASRSNFKKNVEYEMEQYEKGIVRCELGIDQYL